MIYSSSQIIICRRGLAGTYGKITVKILEQNIGFVLSVKFKLTVDVIPCCEHRSCASSSLYSGSQYPLQAPLAPQECHHLFYPDNRMRGSQWGECPDLREGL